MRTGKWPMFTPTNPSEEQCLPSSPSTQQEAREWYCERHTLSHSHDRRVAGGTRCSHLCLCTELGLRTMRLHSEHLVHGNVGGVFDSKLPSRLQKRIRLHSERRATSTRDEASTER
ncbi:hypothetical protein C8Q76DRAFT_68682 [Earliella scabrosa]|nr:hypothetical protein C8Q76DRAFT_68682 [Earliella scabrosa]